MTQISTEWKEVKYVYVGYDSSGNHNVWWRMYARISAQSGSSTTVEVEGRLYISGSGWLRSGATTTSGGVVGGYSAWGIDVSGTYTAGQEHPLWRGSASTTGSSIGAGVRFYSSPWGWTGENLYISDTLTFSPPSSPPTGLGANNVVRGVEDFTANVYISSWGTGGTSAGRYRELQCWTYDPNNLAQPRRYQPVYGDSLSGNITVSNSSSYTQAYGPLNITGNTLYTLGLYASNGASAVGSQRLGDYTTLAYAPVLTLDSINGSTLTINYTTRADGGRYEKTYEYSIDGGTTWTTFATLSTGAASSGSFTTTGYTPGTSYVIKSRVTTQSGTTNADDLTIYEPLKNKFYGPVNGEATNAYKLYGSVNGQTKEIKKLYGSVNGESTRIF